MASLVICYEQMAALADQRRSFLNGCYLCLYKSSHTPAGSDTLSTYAAIEADFPGYARHLVSEFSSPGFLNGSNQGEIDASIITYTMTGSSPTNDIYGWFLADPTQTYCVAAQGGTTILVSLVASGNVATVKPQWLVEQGT